MSSVALFNGEEARRGAAAPRRLGQVFVPSRNLYAIYFPLLMLAAALVCWVVETDFMLMVGSVVLSITSLWVFFDIVVLRAPIRLSSLLFSTLGLGYGLGTANTWFTLPRTDLSLGEYLHHDPVILTHTMGSVLFSMAVLLALGEAVEAPLFGEEFVLEFPPQVVVFISVGVMLIVVAYATHALDYMGATHGENGQLGIFASFSAWLIGTLFAITLVAALNTRQKGVRRYLMLLTAVQFLLEIPIGRRSLIYTMVLALIALRLGPHQFRWSWLKRAVVGVILAGLLYVATIAFFYMRLAGFSKQGLNIVDRVSLALEYFETKNYAEVSKTFSTNVQTRTFILGFLAEMEAFSTKFTPGYGVDLGMQTVSAVPSILYPDKNRTTSEEGLSNELFGTTYTDEANSVLTAGAVDFGLFGMVVYPILIVAVLRFLLEFIGQTLPTFVAAFIIIGTIGRVLQPENSITDYIIIVRNGVLFGIIVWGFIALPAFRLRDPSR